LGIEIAPRELALYCWLPSPVCTSRDIGVRHDEIITVKGTVSDFQFNNPHVMISVDAKDDKGKVENVG